MLFPRRKTYRISFAALLASVFLCSAIFAGCGEQSATDKKATPAGASSTSTNRKAQFGPVYEVGEISDRIVEKVLEGAEKPTSLVKSAEIVGYLVDWTIRQADEVSIRETIVMKSGGLFDNPLQANKPMHRPRAAFGKNPPTRIAPESAAEARAREAALAAARENLKRVDKNPAFAKKSTPLVFGYLVRIHRRDRSSYDVLVDSDGTGQRIVGSNYKPLR